MNLNLSSDDESVKVNVKWTEPVNCFVASLKIKIKSETISEMDRADQDSWKLHVDVRT